MTKRMAPIVIRLISLYQTGFLPGRFIGENGLMVHIIVQQAQHQSAPGIGFLLNQEKAYDRVLGAYLTQALHAFGFPCAFIDSLNSLFFGNSVRINVKGFFTTSVHQERGLWQGDPLPPLLFNLALEPLLLPILQDESHMGYLSTHSD